MGTYITSCLLVVHGFLLGWSPDFHIVVDAGRRSGRRKFQFKVFFETFQFTHKNGSD